MHGRACKEYIFRPYNTSTFNAMRFDEILSHDSAKKEDKKRLRVSDSELLWVVLKWHHGREGVKWATVAFTDHFEYVLRTLFGCYMAGATWNCCHVDATYTIQPCSMSRHFTQSQSRRVQACLAVTCHLHFWQNDRECLRATAVTRGWKGYRNKSSAS